MVPLRAHTRHACVSSGKFTTGPWARVVCRTSRSEVQLTSHRSTTEEPVISAYNYNASRQDRSMSPSKWRHSSFSHPSNRWSFVRPLYRRCWCIVTIAWYIRGLAHPLSFPQLSLGFRRLLPAQKNKLTKTMSIDVRSLSLIDRPCYVRHARLR